MSREFNPTKEMTDQRFEDAVPEADPGIGDFLDLWREARGSALVPPRTAIDPTAIPTLLPSVWLTEYDAEADEFRYRLAGEEINRAWGRSVRGILMKEPTGEADHPEMLRRWKSVIGVPLIHYGKKSEQLSRIPGKVAERLLLPYADEDGKPVYILGLSLYSYDSTIRDQVPLSWTDSIQFGVDTV